MKELSLLTSLFMLWLGVSFAQLDSVEYRFVYFNLDSLLSMDTSDFRTQFETFLRTNTNINNLTLCRVTNVNGFVFLESPLTQSFVSEVSDSSIFFPFYPEDPSLNFTIYLVAGTFTHFAPYQDCSLNPSLSGTVFSVPSLSLDSSGPSIGPVSVKYTIYAVVALIVVFAIFALLIFWRFKHPHKEKDTLATLDPSDWLEPIKDTAFSSVNKSNSLKSSKHGGKDQ